MGPDFVCAANIRIRVVRAVLALSVNFLLVTKVYSAIVTLCVAARAVVAACSQIHHTRAAFLCRWIVAQFAANSVDASLVAEEEARVIGMKSTTLGVGSSHTSDYMAVTAFEVKV